MPHLLTFLVTLIAIVVSGFLPLLQEQPDQWSPRQAIPGANDLADVAFMVADQNRTVHAFFTQPIVESEQEQAVFYSQWTLREGWTTAVDILLPPPPFGWLTDVMGAFLDHDGTIHLIYNGGDTQNADIYYTRAPASSAGQARSWSEPKVIGPDVSLATIDIAALAGDGQGNLFVVYVGGPGRMGIYGLWSEDGGSTWTNPMPIYLTDDAESIPSTVQLHLDQQGRLHAVWLVNTVTGTGQSVFYARLEADHETWNDPIVLAQVGQYDYRLEDNVIGSRVEWPTIAAHDDELMVIYTACEPCEQRMRRSTDGGQSWTDPVEPFRTRGSYGWPALVTDGDNVLHMVLTDRARYNALWHSEWRNGQWQEPESLAPSDGPAGVNARSYDPFWPRAVISQGNLLLVSWSQDPGTDQNGISYSYKILDIPENPVAPLPTTTATATPTATPVVSPTMPSQTPFVISTDSEVTLPTTTSASSQATRFLIIGLTPTALLIAAIVLFRHFVRRDRRRGRP